MDENDQFELDRKDELNRRMDIGEMDMWSENHSTLPPNIDKMKGLTIEITFEYLRVDGAKCLDWYRGKIIKMMNEKKICVKIEWDEITLVESNMQFSVHNLMPDNWKPKKIIKGVLRNYIAY